MYGLSQYIFPGQVRLVPKRGSKFLNLFFAAEA